MDDYCYLAVAAFVISAIGNLSQLFLHMADKTCIKYLEGQLYTCRENLKNCQDKEAVGQIAIKHRIDRRVQVWEE
jgi:hypothetical protein